MKTKNRFDISAALKELRLTHKDASALFRVNIRTVRRWVQEPLEVTGPARESIKAWLILDRIGMPWRPDGIDIVPDTGLKVIKVSKFVIEER